MAPSLEAGALVDCSAPWNSVPFLNFLYEGATEDSLDRKKRMQYLFAIYLTVLLILPPSKILEK